MLGQRRAGACGIDTFGGALYLPAGLPDGLGSFESEAGDPLCRLPPLDLRPRQARVFIAASEWVAHRDAKTPCRVIRGERLGEGVAEASIERGGHDARKPAGAQELRAREAAATIRRLESDIG